jgi:hypothetical protein
MLSFSSIKIYTQIRLAIIRCLMDEKVILDEEKLCRDCSHQRRDHKYDINNLNNDLKCGLLDCECINFVEWI